MAGLVAAVLLTARHSRAHRLARAVDGDGPAVVTDDGVQLHVEVDGPPDAPVTVVFAHGFAARAGEFAVQREALRSRARLVLFDQRGHGRSGWGGHRAATIDRLGRDLGQVIDQVGGPKPVVVVSHSMGGMALLCLAGQRPELFRDRVVGVALLSTLAGPLASAGVRLPAVRLTLRVGLAAGLARLLWLTAPIVDAAAPFRRRWGRRWLQRRLFGAGRPPEWTVSAMQDMWVGTSHSMAAAFYAGLAAYDQRQSLAALRETATLVLAGTADATIPARCSERLAGELGAGARLTLVPGAGHMVNMTHPQPVNAALRELLDRVAPGERDGNLPHDKRELRRIPAGPSRRPE